MRNIAMYVQTENKPGFGGVEGEVSRFLQDVTCMSIDMSYFLFS